MHASVRAEAPAAFPAYGVLCLALLLVLASCAEAGGEKAYTFTRFAMDTVVEYTIVAPSGAAARRAMEAAHAEIERVERLLWEEDSLSQIYTFNHAGGPVTLDPEAVRFLERARAYAQRSRGAFDITIKPVLDLYDFAAETPVPPSEEAIRERLPLVGTARIDFSKAPVLDKPEGVAVAVGGVAKGYAVDRAVAVLKANGVRHALVNAGGDLYCLGTHLGKPWRVGIRDPDDPGALVDVLYVSDLAVATSGDYQRYFVYEGRRYHHILHPGDGQPARSSRSATVIAATTEEADALATALFVAGAVQGIALIDSLPGVAGMVVEAAGTVVPSRRYGRFTR